MQPNRAVNQPRKGMNRDKNPVDLTETEYTFSLNSNIGSEIGDSFFLQEEPSNLLCNRLEGFVVVGREYDVNTNRTYYLLSNAQTGVSEIGYITNNPNVGLDDDARKECNCDVSNDLAQPLETQEPVANCTYTVLANDACNLCIGFSINFPVRKIIIKYEHTGTTLWWTDANNTMRYFKVDEPDYYKEVGDATCGEEPEPTCFDCDKIRVFKRTPHIEITPESIQQGGRLKAGEYEVLVAYSSLNGIEISPYFSITNPIAIFDLNNTILTQPELEYETNFGIRLKVDNLDTNFAYYKIAVIYTGGVSGTSYYAGQVYSTSNKEINITSLQGLQPITLSAIMNPRRAFDKADGVGEANGVLFWKGTTEQEEVNFQPCANLLGAFVRWQTVETTETLYQDGVAASKYKSALRDEVYPLAIQLHYDNGTSSADFPLINRPPTEQEVETVDNKDVQSINQYTPQCTEGTRDKRWQFYNTATDEGFYGDDTLVNYNTIERQTIKTCIVEDVHTEAELVMEVDCSATYLNLRDYIERYRDDICEPSSDLYNAQLCEILTDEYEETCDLSEIFGENCDEPELLPNTTEIFINEVENEVVDITYQELSDLVPIPPPENCNAFKPGGDDGYDNDDNFMQEFMSCFDVVYKRNGSGTNSECVYAESIPFISANNIQGLSSKFMQYAASEVLTDLVTTKTSVASTGFENKVHVKALWFKVSFDGRDTIPLEITKMSECEDIDDISVATSIRVTTFNTCSATSHIESFLVPLNAGNIVELSATDYPSGTAYIAIDSPIRSYTRDIVGNYSCCVPTVDCDTEVVYQLTPPCGCFSILAREYECKERTVTITNAVFSKREKYIATCEYKVPINSGCEPIPYKYGKFGYYESTNTYPDNKELYDSSNLNIFLENIPVDFRDEFEDYFINESGQLDADFTCKPIRHYRFPDFNVSPYMSTEQVVPFGDSFIYPIGATINENLINFFLDVAVDNDLMSKNQRDSVIGYTLKIGDRTINKSIIAKGIANDMFSYTEVGATNPTPILFANFPYNDNRENKLLYTNNNRNQLIQHPYGGTQNHNFTFHSPETSFNKPTLPTEIKVEAHQYGFSRGNFAAVDDHAKYVVLGSDAYSISTALAITEVALETAIKVGDYLAQGLSSQWFIAYFGPSSGVGASQGIAGGALGISIFTAATALNGFLTIGTYRKQWLDIFYDMGQPRNFASFYTSVGKYNYAVGNAQEGDMLRAIKTSKYLKTGNYQFTEEFTGETIKINNRDRESSVYISTGNDYTIEYPLDFVGFDNSREEASTSIGCENSLTSSTLETQIASQYVSIKNWIPDQYGQIGDIKWISTGYYGDLRNPKEFPQIFGGDIFISRFTKKIKFPFFRATAMNLADRTPYNYTIHRNVGVPKYYGDFYTTTNNSFNSALFPEMSTDYHFDCLAGESSSYVRNPSKFYLFHYGIPSFLVESEINLNYRYAREGLENNFYPNIEDFIEWTQESRVPIRQDNTYYYNNVYSKKTTHFNNRSLPIDYDKEYFRKIIYQPNNVFYSIPDVSDIDKFEPWLAYRPLDFKNFSATMGRLVDVSGIESQQVLLRFENGMLRYNAIDVLRERVTPETQMLGTGGIFAQRPLEFKRTKLGYSGTQHVAMESCEAGHFWADAKRGQVFRLDQSGEQLTDITVGCSKWFKEHLPFKILNKGIQNLTATDVDNNFKGIGITMAWDSKFKRLFLTKLDKVPVPGQDLCFANGEFYSVANQATVIEEYENDGYTFDGYENCGLNFSRVVETEGEPTIIEYQFVEATPVDINDERYFTDASWTAAYSPQTESWISYYSFKPNFYVSLQDYFQSGNNFGSGKGVWSHLLTNRSYRVFYGSAHPWIVEAPTKPTLDKKILSSLNIYTQSQRFHNEYDTAPMPTVGFENAIIYNNTNNSGLLNLINEEKNNLFQKTQYPKTNPTSQDVLVTQYEDMFKLNHFFNRVKNEKANMPLWIKDINDIDKVLDYDNLTYKSPLPERMKGNWFLTRYYKLKNTQVHTSLLFNLDKETLYQ